MKHWPVMLLLVLSVTSLLLSVAIWHDRFPFISWLIRKPWYWLACLTFLVILVVQVCYTLTDIFNLRKQENGITWSQITILGAIVLWILGFVVIFDVQHQSRYTMALLIIGTVLSWVFQDTLRGVVAFVHLRLNHLLNIDDWIQIPKYNVDGMVKRVTLTTVTIYNWDTTTSSIPTNALHFDHFVNFQKMADGKTYGRQMIKTFFVDVSCVHPVSSDEIDNMKQQMIAHDGQLFLLEEDFAEGVLNARLYRLYLCHWLMNHPHVSQMPCLIVRWRDMERDGMTLQVYAFIVDSSLVAFEWMQSQIIEHIVESMEWFGLRPYQSPSCYDVRNSVRGIEKEIGYRKEAFNE